MNIIIIKNLKRKKTFPISIPLSTTVIVFISNFMCFLYSSFSSLKYRFCLLCFIFWNGKKVSVSDIRKENSTSNKIWVSKLERERKWKTFLFELKTFSFLSLSRSLSSSLISLKFFCFFHYIFCHYLIILLISLLYFPKKQNEKYLSGNIFPLLCLDYGLLFSGWTLHFKQTNTQMNNKRRESLIHLWYLSTHTHINSLRRFCFFSSSNT